MFTCLNRVTLVSQDSNKEQINRIALYVSRNTSTPALLTTKQKGNGLKVLSDLISLRAKDSAKFCLQMKWKFGLSSQFLNGTIS